MARYQTEIPNDINELLKSAAKRDGRSKEKFIQSLLKREADKEKRTQEKEQAVSVPVLVLGDSGTGKTRSIKSLNPQETLIIQPITKPLPFKSGDWKKWDSTEKKGSKIHCDDYMKIRAIIHKAESYGKKYIVIDDAQYLMLNDELSRTDEIGFKKFTDMAKSYVELIKFIANDSSNLIVYLMTHTETNEQGEIKAKTTGKMIREKVVLEGLFSIVLRCHAKDGNHFFTTKTNGMDCVKTPEEMFEENEIENDLTLVNKEIINYGYLEN